MKMTSWLLLSWIAVTHAATCYYPDGSIASNMSPCPDSQACCGTTHACLTNGLCFGANLGVIYRGSCAKKSWPEVDCPNVCWGIQDLYANLFQCPGNSGGWKNMSCSTWGDADTACDKADDFYTWVSGGKVTAAQSGQNNTSQCNTTTNPETTTGAESTIATQKAECDKSASSSTSPVALGAGLGIGLGVPLLLSTALLIYCASSRRQVPSSLPTEIEPVQERKAHPSELSDECRIAQMGSDTATRTELPGSNPK